MALLDFEGFDHMNSSGTDVIYYAANRASTTFAASNAAKTTGRIAGSCVRVTANSGGYMASSFPSASTAIVGFGFYFDSNPSGTADFLRFYESTGGIQCGLAMNSSRQLFVYKGTTATVLGTGSTVLSNSTWYWIELKVLFAGSPTPSYSNAGGSGDRTSSITITTNITAGAGVASALVNGTTAQTYWWTAGQSSREMVFDFGSGAPKVISAFKWNQDVAVGHGNWVFEGSNDNSTYTGLAASFVLGTAAGDQEVTFSNTTGYRYYRLRQIGGITSGSPWVREITFNVVDASVGTGGAYELRLNSATELSNSSVGTTTTSNNETTTIIFGNLNSHLIHTRFDDFYVCDSTGSAPYNNFLGNVRVETLYPTSANSTTFIPNASTNVSRVQETTVDDDTSYNSTSSSGSVDTFNHGALSSTPAQIYAVAVKARMRKDDVYPKQARTKLKSGATTSNGTSGTLQTIYLGFRDQYAADPNTGSAWTATNVNNNKIGYELV